MFSVKDKNKLLQFNGVKLASSTSERKFSVRWIEFNLYKTEGGSYVLSRSGVSLVFHGAACPMTARYKLTESRTDGLDARAVPCETCNPNYELDLVFPEKSRDWVLVTYSAAEIVDALYKYDPESDSHYLTAVAKRLLDQAAKVDSQIESAYTIEIIP